MKDIVVIGGTGFAGRYLVPVLARRKDVRVRVLVHTNAPAELFTAENVVAYKGDLLNAQTLAGLCVENATVVNLAYLRGRPRWENLLATSNLLEACIKARAGRFIHCSTVSVFGRITGNLVTERTECHPVDEYETTKMEIEKRILETAGQALKVAVLRPSAIFGPGGKNLLKLANDLKSRGALSNYIKACLSGSRRMNLVSVHNVVAALVLLIDTTREVGREVFIVSDDECGANNYGYVESQIRSALGLNKYPLPVFPVPSFVLKGLLRLAGKSNYNPCCTYSSEKILSMGFKSAVAFEDALAEFAQWRKVNPEP